MAESGRSSADSAGGFWSGEEKGKQLVGDGRNESPLLTGPALGTHDGRTSEWGQQETSTDCEHRDMTYGKTCDFRNSDTRKKSVDSPDAAPASSSGPDNQKDELWKSVERCISACTKGFVIGSGLRGGLALFTILSRLKRRKSR